MNRIEPTSPAGRLHRGTRRLAVAAFMLVLVGGTTFAACSGATGSTAGAGADASMSSMPSMVAPGAAGPGDMVPADASAAWAARPAFTNASSRAQEAYAYALYHPEVVQWMPCYCGCAAMGHRSNLDCYIKPAVAGAGTVFEEHASYCDLCVQITLKTKQLISEGRSLRDIRAAVDQAFGGSTPGTPTDLPPA